jgi:probable rRNA maturation factor
LNLIETTSTDIEPPPWQGRVAPLCEAVLDALSVDGWELSVLLCSDKTIRRLNRDYRQKDEPTDVLSFSQLEGDPDPNPFDRKQAGDLVISLETTDRDCAQLGIEREEQVKRLLIHGILHLHGMDHQSDTGAMIELQERLYEDIEESLI